MTQPNTTQETSSVNERGGGPALSRETLPGLIEETRREFQRRGGHTNTREERMFETISRGLQSAFASEDQEKIKIYKDLFERARTLFLSSAGGGHKAPPAESAPPPTPTPSPQTPAAAPLPPRETPKPLSSAPLKRASPLEIGPKNPPPAPANSLSDHSPTSATPPSPPLSPAGESRRSAPANSPPDYSPPHILPSYEYQRPTSKRTKAAPPEIPPISLGGPSPQETPLQSALHGEIQGAAIALVPEKAVEEEYDRHMDYLFGASVFMGKGKMPEALAKMEASQILSGSLDHRQAELAGIDLQDITTLKPYIEDAAQKTGLYPVGGESTEIFIKRMIAKDLSRNGKIKD